MKEKLRTYIIEEILEEPDRELADDEPLLSSGLIDSFSIADFSLWIEEELDIDFDEMDFRRDNFDTLNEMVAYLEDYE